MFRTHNVLKQPTCKMGAIWRNEEGRSGDVAAADAAATDADDARAHYPKMDRILDGKCQLRMQKFLALILKVVCKSDAMRQVSSAQLPTLMGDQK